MVDRTPEPDAHCLTVHVPEGQDKEAGHVDSDIDGDTVSKTQDNDKGRSTYKKRKTQAHSAGLAVVMEKNTDAMNIMAEKVMSGAMEAMKAAAEISAEAMRDTMKETETTRGHHMQQMGHQNKEASAMLAKALKYMADTLAARM